MKKDDVKVGGVYAAKVSNKMVRVRIDRANRKGGWDATNLATNKKIRIKSAQRLRPPAKAGKQARAKEAPSKPAKAAAPKGDATPAKAVASKAAATKEAKPKRLGALDAAAQVLARAGQPMRSQEMIAAMAEQGLWKSPAGKTPHATLYAAMLREIANKGADARFKKVERGLFAFNAPGA
jgi:hypothetical protein